MNHWKTSEVVELLKDIPGVSLVAKSPWEDRVTEQLVYQVDGASDRLYVRGFVTDSVLKNGDDTDVEMVEVTTEYSDGDESTEPANILARARVHVALINAGFQVVRSLSAYF